MRDGNTLRQGPQREDACSDRALMLPFERVRAPTFNGGYVNRERTAGMRDFLEVLDGGMS